jgi:hypothetical protein
MKDMGAYHDQGGHAEGKTDRNCAPPTPAPTQQPTFTRTFDPTANEAQIKIDILKERIKQKVHHLKLAQNKALLAGMLPKEMRVRRHNSPRQASTSAATAKIPATVLEKLEVLSMPEKLLLTGSPIEVCGYVM